MTPDSVAMTATISQVSDNFGVAIELEERIMKTQSIGKTVKPM